MLHILNWNSGRTWTYIYLTINFYLTEWHLDVLIFATNHIIYMNTGRRYFKLYGFQCGVKACHLDYSLRLKPYLNESFTQSVWRASSLMNYDQNGKSWLIFRKKEILFPSFCFECLSLIIKQLLQVLWNNMP